MLSHGKKFDDLLEALPIRFVNPRAESLFRLGADDLSDARQAFEAARSMIETSQDSLVALNPEGKTTDINEAASASRN